MIKQIDHNQPNLVAFEFVGEITEKDFNNVVIPEVNRLISEIDKINLLYYLNTDLKQFTAGAWWKDALLGVKNLAKWNRSAIVTDSEFIQKFTDTFSLVMPGEFKGFDKNQLEEAINWASE